MVDANPECVDSELNPAHSARGEAPSGRDERVLARGRARSTRDHAVIGSSADVVAAQITQKDGTASVGADPSNSDRR